MKISKSFILQEFVPKTIYDTLKDRSLNLLDNRIILIAQCIRDIIDAPIVINNWHLGGEYQFSGFRPYDTKIGAENSQHKFGRGIDVKSEAIKAQELYGIILKNKDKLMSLGLTTIEDIAYTQSSNIYGGWVHLDCRFTNKKELLTVKP